MYPNGFELPMNEISEICKRNGIRKLSLYGSALGEHFQPDSDVDLLVEFEPGQKVGMIRMAALARELSDAIGRKVDLRTEAELSRYFRAEVLENCEVQYAQG